MYGNVHLYITCDYVRQNKCLRVKFEIICQNVLGNIVCNNTEVETAEKSKGEGNFGKNKKQKL